MRTFIRNTCSQNTHRHTHTPDLVPPSAGPQGLLGGRPNPQTFRKNTKFLLICFVPILSYLLVIFPFIECLIFPIYLHYLPIYSFFWRFLAESWRRTNRLFAKIPLHASPLMGSSPACFSSRSLVLCFSFSFSFSLGSCSIIFRLWFGFLAICLILLSLAFYFLSLRYSVFISFDLIYFLHFFFFSFPLDTCFLHQS